MAGGARPVSESAPGPSPRIMLNTPFGTPAASRFPLQISAENGECPPDLSTIVQPQASAGATLAATWLIGQL